MPRRRPAPPHAKSLRTSLANEAAKWIVEAGIHDYALVRRKIARRHAIHDPTVLPRDHEILEAIQLYQRLFSKKNDEQLERLRIAALQAMHFFERFHPRLTGPVLDGTANLTTPIDIHLHTNDMDAVQRFLEDHHIPARLRSQRMDLTRTHQQDVLVWSIWADNQAFHIAVLPETALRQAPLTSDLHQTIKRASARQLSNLIGRSHDQGQR